MIVDCDTCTVRGGACGDCVITVLLGAPPGRVELDGSERRALDTLAAAGMVPRLQLVPLDEAGREPSEQAPVSEREGGNGRRRGEGIDLSLAERSPICDERSKRHVG